MSLLLLFGGGGNFAPTIGAGIVAYAIDLPTAIEYEARWDGTRWKCYRKRPEDAAFVFVANIVTTPTGQYAGIEANIDGQHTLMFVLNSSSTPTRLLSYDFGKTWN